MIYRPGKGAMWDPSVVYHEGTYYAFMMYDKDGTNGLRAGHCLLATSEDGVHWEDFGVVVEEREINRGCRFFKCFVGRVGNRFVMDHGVWRPEGQDTLRYYESDDLKSWRYLSSNSPDPKWYVTTRRWDHMYLLPKEEGRPESGYWGYPVATPKKGLARGMGMTETVDGREWTILPPPEMEWGETPPRDLEIGGCERFNGKYYVIGGTGKYISNGYSMYTWVGDGPRGPFRPDVEAYRLCGTTHATVTWLAAWCRGNDELLISNYASLMGETHKPWMLPLRKPVVDSDGHLRLGWWKENEKLKGVPVGLGQVSESVRAKAAPRRITWLKQELDMAGGMVVEGTIRATAAGTRPFAGFAFGEPGGGATEVWLGIGPAKERESHIGRWNNVTGFTSHDVTGRGCATVTGIDDDVQHSFRILTRHDCFELYIDDMLMQTHLYQTPCERVGFVAKHSEAEFNDLKAWTMSLRSR